LAHLGVILGLDQREIKQLAELRNDVAHLGGAAVDVSTMAPALVRLAEVLIDDLQIDRTEFYGHLLQVADDLLVERARSVSMDVQARSAHAQSRLSELSSSQPPETLDLFLQALEHPARTSEDHEHTVSRIWPVTCGIADRGRGGRVTTGTWC
jgi:hypothetical protein